MAAAAKPVLTTRVARTQDIDSAIESCSENIGRVASMSRDSLNWLMTIRDDGELAMGGVVPSLIQWQADKHKHPAEGLHDYGLVLIELVLHHANVEQVDAMLASINFDGAVSVKRTHSSVPPYLKAMIETPIGVRPLVVPGKTFRGVS